MSVEHTSSLKYEICVILLKHFLGFQYNVRFFIHFFYYIPPLELESSFSCSTLGDDWGIVCSLRADVLLGQLFQTVTSVK